MNRALTNSRLGRLPDPPKARDVSAVTEPKPVTAQPIPTLTQFFREQANASGMEVGRTGETARSFGLGEREDPTIHADKSVVDHSSDNLSILSFPFHRLLTPRCEEQQ